MSGSQPKRRFNLSIGPGARVETRSWIWPRGISCGPTKRNETERTCAPFANRTISVARTVPAAPRLTARHANVTSRRIIASPAEPRPHEDPRLGVVALNVDQHAPQGLELDVILGALDLVPRAARG